jgi:serpin B
MRKLIGLFLILVQGLFAEETMAYSHNRLAISLFNQVKENTGNFFFSPFSVYTALGALYVGSKGTTENEIISVLGSKMDKKEFALSYKNLADSLKLQNFYSANGVWVDNNYSLLPAFTQFLHTYLQTTLFSVDFVNDASNAAINANRWVASKTNGKISRLLQEKDLDSSTRLLLINAVYFMGKWVNSFPVQNTQPDFFYSASNEKMSVAMMNQEHSYLYAEDDEAQVIALPIQKTSLVCLLVLPKNSLDSLSITPEIFSTWMNNLNYVSVNLSVPKFTFSTRLDLIKPLASLGVHEAFQSSANFSAIGGKTDLFVSKMFQQSYIRFEETGIEAAAATAVVMNMTCCRREDPPIIFKADKPFLIFLVDKNSQIILFMGKVEKP